MDLTQSFLDESQQKWLYSKVGLIKALQEVKGYSNESGTDMVYAMIRHADTPTLDVLHGFPYGETCNLFSRINSQSLRANRLNRRIMYKGTEVSFIEIFQEFLDKLPFKIEIANIPIIDAVILLPARKGTIYFGGEIDIKDRYGFLAVFGNSEIAIGKDERLNENFDLKSNNLIISKSKNGNEVGLFYVDGNRLSKLDEIANLNQSTISVFTLLTSKENSKMLALDYRSSYSNLSLSSNLDSLLFPAIVNLIPFVYKEESGIFKLN